MISEKPRLSAHSLKEFDRCPRAFALRYKSNRYWPTADTKGGSPTDLGQDFHRLVHQHHLGISPNPDSLSPELATLWQRYLASHFDGGDTWSEQPLQFSLGEASFFARFDRLLFDREKQAWTIVDWKTGKLDPAALAEDWQTKLYPFLLAEAGEVFGLGPIPPERITIVYWEGATGKKYRFPYSPERHAMLERAFMDKAAQVLAPFDEEAFDDPAFPRKSIHCKKCGYDSLCNLRELARKSEARQYPEPRFIE